ncbi:hypothetical protein [Nocardioides sp.]|uniref:hypothetical protein n=1 Tax=Nocardioides sp. TaxID=35761 RepID=UPI00261832E0|nr:hypothetical protein [Nocardioides sp.]
MTGEADEGARGSFRRGLRLGVPFAVVGFFLSVSFGVLARQAGFSVAQASLTAMIVFAGRRSSQRCRSWASAVASRPR